MMKSDFQTVCTKVPGSVYDALKRAAEETDFSISSIIRQLIIDGLNLPEYESEKIACSKRDGRSFRERVRAN